MSGPFRFNGQESRSPLDRPPQNLFPAGQPPSFKTNVNRSKTKKWVEAKPYSYDGDDWGDVDEYDEYGADEPQAPPQQAFRQPVSRFDQSSRSFTDPQQQDPPQPARRNSFEAGEEHRAFSAGTYPPQPPYAQQTYGTPAQPPSQMHPTHRQASAAESDTSDTPQHRRDFNPAALPPPLHTKISPAPGSASGSPLNPKYPTRKSSIGQVDSPSAMSPTSPGDRAPSNPTKPLPFIRPADIYKRVEEERLRERAASMDSSRPSLDSLSSRPQEGAISPPGPDLGKSADPKSLHPLETVSEGRSDLPEYSAASGHAEPQASQDYQSPILPQVRRISAFDNDFWTGDQHQQASESQTQATAPSDDQGFRSVVDQAFTRSDDQRSVPPTPISKDSDLSRSNTESTSGISPIMSRVPSSATSALKNRNNGAGDGSTPMIAEEASESSTPAVSRPTSTMLGGPYTVARKPSPTSHDRNLSSSSLPRSGLATPSRGDSPARSPVIEPQKSAPRPESALYNTLSPDSPETAEGGMGPTYATREADIASAIKLSPTKAAPALGAAEIESQDAFLASHQSPDSPLSDAAPRSRSESPSKGRVQTLAGKFGDVSHSRRGSTQSNTSRNSIQSWERSPENSRPSSPTKATTSRPISPTKEGLSARPPNAREASFRPKLPGQWESYATTNATPSDQGDRDMQLTGDTPMTPEGQQGLSPLDEVDLTPTTAKHPVLSTDPTQSSKSPSDALAALKAAGTAMGEALQASIGLGSSADHVQQDRETEAQARSYGDVYQSRPLQLGRTESSNSSIPPTPPAKDSPESEDEPPLPPLKEKTRDSFSSSSQQQTPVRPTIVPQLSTDVSVHDQESDRLRKEIVASLTPLKTSHEESSGQTLPTTVPATENRASSILPSEYDSYWAGGEQTSPRASHDLDRNVSEPAGTSAQPPVTANEPSDAIKPPLLNQFSWEGNQSHLALSEGQAQAGADAQALPHPEEEKEVASATAQRPTQDIPSQSYEGIPEPYFGPSYTAAVTKPDSVEEPIAVRSPTPPPASEKPRASLERAVSPPAGLHVVNTEMDPEAVDMPPRLSAQTSLISQPSLASPVDSAGPRQMQEHTGATTTAPISSSVTSQDHTAKSPTSDKPLGFRDIVTMKSPTERIATYNKTREYWAKADHGLSDWIASAVAANPQLEAQSLQHRPTISAVSPSRHKATGSLSLFGKKEGSSHTPAPATPYNDSTAAQSPSAPYSAGASESRPQVFGAGSSGGRSASHGMQTKGKDLLHTAGVLGGKGLGKGMTSAKGLFAKGKSRFGKSSGDKATHPDSTSSSREASEEPELMSTTTTPDRTSNHTFTHERGMRMSVDFDSPKVEEKKRRRMSSPFHRSSRSRSRPSSIVLPRNAHLDFGFGSTPRNTPPRETPPAEGSRPQSFHAPDSWNVMPDSQQVSSTQSTPPRGGDLLPPERLGILPSPAKSAFSLLPQDREYVIPPVPPIPDGMEERQRRRESQDSMREQRMIQSIVRYSTPPSMDLDASKHLDEATFKDVPSPPNHVHLQLQNAITSAAREAAPPEAHSTQLDSRLKALALKQLEADNRPPQVNNHGVPPLSVPTPEQVEEDDDDLPPQLTYEPPQLFRLEPDISPELGPTVPETRQSSLVISTSGLENMEESDDEDDRPPYLDLGSSRGLMQRPQHAIGDVSPMLPAAMLAVSSNASERSNAAVENEDVAMARRASAQAEVLLYEEIGAGDVSPVTLHDQGEEATPTQTREHAQQLSATVPRQTGHGKVASTAELISAPTEADTSAGAILDANPNLYTSGKLTAPPPKLATQPRLSASPYQVVHAVQYVPSRSSLDSWEQDSVVAPSQSDGSQLGDRRDESEIPPVPLIPPASSMAEVEEKSEPQHFPGSPQPTINIAGSNGSFREHPLHSDPAQEESQSTHQAETASSESRQRAPSILSVISSMVAPDGVSISSPSSQVSRSRSPSANPHLQGSSAKSSPVPPQILEEATHAEQDTMAIPISDDYDLYEDLNGVVKDEKGQPMRVAAAPVPATAKASKPSKFGAARVVAVPKTREEDARRYSDERPMSFVSGPRDAHGRPQDEINTAAQANIPPVPRIPSHQLQSHPQSRPNQPSYTTAPPTQPLPHPPLAQHRNHDSLQQQQRSHELLQQQRSHEIQQQRSHEIQQQRTHEIQQQQLNHERQQQQAPTGAARPQTVSPIQSSVHSERVRTPPHSNVSPPPPSNASPPPQPSPPPALAHRPLLQEIRMASPIQIPPLLDPRLQLPLPQDPRLQSPPVQGQRLQSSPLQDPRQQGPPVQGQRLQSSPLQDPRQQGPPVQDQRLQSSPLQDPRQQGPPIHDPRMQNFPPQDPRMQDPRFQDPRFQDPRLQDPRSPQDPRPFDPRLMADPQAHGGQPVAQDPRFEAQQSKQTYKTMPRMFGQPAGPPRNQYELQQQQMQRQVVDPRQVIDPRLRDAEYGLPGVSAAQSNTPPAKQVEKGSSRPKFGSVFKSLGGKSHSTIPQTSQQPNNRIDPSLSVPQQAIRSASYQSSLGDLPEQTTPKRERRASAFGSLSSRPKSMAESHISEDSTRVQAADSRLDLRYPASPAPFKGIPPQQTPQGAPLPPQQPQSQRMSTSAVPEKKKRFSSLGNLFSRGGANGHAGPPKTKLTKEEKKMQKVQRHSAVPQMQPPPSQQWPQQQQQYTMQYGPPPPQATRAFPGMQGIAPQNMSPQNMTPISPPGGPYPNGMPSQVVPKAFQQHVQQQQLQQRMPQQMSPQQQVPQQMSPQQQMPQQMSPQQQMPQQMSPQQQMPQQMPPQQQMPQQMSPQQQMPQQMPPQQQLQSPQLAPNGSAYIATRQLAQRQQLQGPLPQSPQSAQSSRLPMHTPSFSFEQPTQQVESAGQPPLNGYYNPDSKRTDSGSSVPGFMAVDHQQQRQPAAPQHPTNMRRVSSPSPNNVPQAVTPVLQRRVSLPLAEAQEVQEAQYETPPIPAAYNHVTGVYTSPRTQSPTHTQNFQIPQAALHPSPNQLGSNSGQQYPDPHMQRLSPQISEQSQGPNERSNSNSSIPVSPISNPSPGIPSAQPPSNQKPQKPRMTSISEATQQQERPWNLNVREGATEQEIVRARQQQYLEQQLASQEQLHAQRTGQSPSPRPSQQSQTPSPRPHVIQQQQLRQPSPGNAQVAGGFREVLPRHSPHPMSQPQHQAPPNLVSREQQHSPAPSASPRHLQPAPVRPDDVTQPAAYPLPMSPASVNTSSPVNPLAGSLPPPPPPNVPHSPMRPAFNANQTPAPEHQQHVEQVHAERHQHQDYQPPFPEQQLQQPEYEQHTQHPDYSQHTPHPDYEQQPHDEPPPSYDGPGVPHDGMEKEDRPRPPNITTTTQRQRQPSIGLLQHPQPASMAASPSRSSADMGAAHLRQQLLEQEERALAERMYRAEIQRVETARERQERERARARARELERSVSGGGRVGSLRSVAGSARGGGGWERRGSTTRPVFELPGELDDEPVMRATSFPGQEWVPAWNGED